MCFQLRMGKENYRALFARMPSRLNFKRTIVGCWIGVSRTTAGTWRSCGATVLFRCFGLARELGSANALRRKRSTPVKRIPFGFRPAGTKLRFQARASGFCSRWTTGPKLTKTHQSGAFPTIGDCEAVSLVARLIPKTAPVLHLVMSQVERSYLPKLGHDDVYRECSSELRSSPRSNQTAHCQIRRVPAKVRGPFALGASPPDPQRRPLRGLTEIRFQRTEKPEPQSTKTEDDWGTSSTPLEIRRSCSGTSARCSHG